MAGCTRARLLERSGQVYIPICKLTKACDKFNTCMPFGVPHLFMKPASITHLIHLKARKINKWSKVMQLQAIVCMPVSCGCDLSTCMHDVSHVTAVHIFTLLSLIPEPA